MIALGLQFSIWGLSALVLALLARRTYDWKTKRVLGPGERPVVPMIVAESGALALFIGLVNVAALTMPIMRGLLFLPHHENTSTLPLWLMLPPLLLLVHWLAYDRAFKMRWAMAWIAFSFATSGGLEWLR